LSIHEIAESDFEDKLNIHIDHHFALTPTSPREAAIDIFGMVDNLESCRDTWHILLRSWSAFVFW
jgi:hypothetical protein